MNRIIYLLLPFFIVTGVCDAQKKVTLKIKKPVPFTIRKLPAPTIKYMDSSKKEPEVIEISGLPGSKTADIDLNPVQAGKSDTKFNKYSNNRVLTENDIVLSKLVREVDAEKKISSNALLIYGSNGKVLSFDLARQAVTGAIWRRGSQAVAATNLMWMVLHFMCLI